jgi:YesN/AraC family two-component response regulator
VRGGIRAHLESLNALTDLKKKAKVTIVNLGGLMAGPSAATKVLLVDDDEIVLSTLSNVLELSGFGVTSAATVPEALRLICSETYDVLLTDLHMPGAGDGLTLISAMRHANPKAVTLLLSAFPQMAAATQAILLQADEILVKPMDVASLVSVIKHRVAAGPFRNREILSVAAILERNTESTIHAWFHLLEEEEKVASILMNYEQRCAHLPQLFRELVSRLQSSQMIGSKEKVSIAAAEHGLSRHKQGYSAAMLVEESRMLQVSIFQTLQRNLASIDFSLLLIGVMIIADEIDSQLSQAIASYTAESVLNPLPAQA